MIAACPRSMSDAGSRAPARSRCAAARSSTASRRSSRRAARRSTTRRSPRCDAPAAALRRARRVSRGAPVDAEAPVRAAGRSARRLPVGRRRPRQELPDGQLLRDGADPAQDARPLPRVHARRARGARDAEATRPIRSRPSPRASRGAWRLICFDEFHVVRHRRRDDPRAPAGGAVRRTASCS